MAEEPIRGEQIIQPDWAANATKSANELDAAIQKLIAHTGVLAKSNLANFANNDPKNTDDINAQTKAVEQNTKIEKQNIEAKILAAQVNKKIKDEIQATLSSYSRLSLEYRKAAQAAKDLAAADILQGKAFSEATKEAINKAAGLNNQLKTIDQSMGNYQRNVGNYHSAVGNLAKGLGGLTGVVTLLGTALGINTDALITLKDTTRELIKFSKDLSHIKHLETIVEVESTVAHEANTIAVVSETVAVENATIAQKAWNYVMSINPIALLITSVALFAAGIYQLVTAETEAEKAQRKLNEAQQVGALNEAENVSYVKEKIEDLTAIQSLRIRQMKADGASETEIYQQKVKDIVELQDKYHELRLTLEANRDAESLVMNQFKKGSEEYTSHQKNVISMNRELELLKITQSETVVTTSELTKSFKDLNKEVTDSWKEMDKWVDEALKGVKTADEIKKSIADSLEDLKAWNEEQAKRREGIVIYDEEAKGVRKLSTEYDRLNKTKAGLIGGESGSGKALTDKELENDKKKNEEKINAAKKLSEQLFKIAEDRIKREQELNKQNITEIDKGIDQQLQLLIAGQKNTYDFMLRQKAKALEEQAALDKKARKEKEAQQIAELFLEFMKVNAKDGFGAAAKSLAETLLAKGLAGGLSGYYEGTEDTGAGGGLDTKGGMLAVLHPHERVLTAKQNAAIGAISNDDLVKSVMHYKIPTEKNSTVVDLQNSILISELKELNNTIKNKKELEVNWNRLNEIILTNKQNGYSVETTYKNSPIIKRNAPFN